MAEQHDAWFQGLGLDIGSILASLPAEDLSSDGPGAARSALAQSTADAPVSFPGDDEEQPRIADARGPDQSRSGAPVSFPGDDQPPEEPVPEDATPRALVDAVEFVVKKATEFGIGKLLGVPGIIIDLPFGAESDESPDQREARKRQEEKDQKEFEDEQAKEQKELQEANERGRAPVELNPIKVLDAPAERETDSSVSNALASPAPDSSESAREFDGSGGGGSVPEQIVGEPGISESDDDD